MLSKLQSIKSDKKWTNLLEFLQSKRLEEEVIDFATQTKLTTTKNKEIPYSDAKKHL